MDYVADYLFDGDYILITEDGFIDNGKGYPIVQRIRNKNWENNHAHVLKSKNGYTNSLLYLIMKDLSVLKMQTGSIQKKTQDNLNKYKIVYIPIHLVNKLDSIENILSKKQYTLIEENNYLMKFRDWLLPMLMNGQLEIA